MIQGRLPKIVVERVHHRYVDRDGQDHEVLRDISLEIEAGELVCLLGPSGCGKSTLIGLLAGFERPQRGRVLIDGHEVVGPSPRRIILFQEGGLLPWRTALQNVKLGLDAQRMPTSEARERARSYLALVGLAEHEHRFPHQLSGGMRQRVALARALAVEPDVLFMDEPFGALDTFTRFRMQDEILRIFACRKTTVVIVTHDIDEAVYLGHRIVLLDARPGRVADEIIPDLARPIVRTSEAFGLARAKVFRTFAAVGDR